MMMARVFVQGGVEQGLQLAEIELADCEHGKAVRASACAIAAGFGRVTRDAQSVRTTARRRPRLDHIIIIHLS